MTKKITYIDRNGYLRYKHNDKLVHHCVLEEQLGYRIPWNHDVHHINQNKLDNRLDNLIALPHSIHFIIHQLEDEHPDFFQKRAKLELKNELHNLIHMKIEALEREIVNLHYEINALLQYIYHQLRYQSLADYGLFDRVVIP